MIGIIKSQREAKGFKTTEALSRALVALFPQDFHEYVDKPRHLSAKISDLDKGRRVWWDREPPRLLERLLELLGLNEDELPLDGNSERHVITFHMFPAAPALDLRRESAWELGSEVLMKDGRPRERIRFERRPALENWFEPNRTPYEDGRLDWLQISDAMEHRIVTAKLAISHGGDFIVRDSLAEVLERDVERLRSSAPLVIAIRDNTSFEKLDNELDVLARHRASAPRLIVSRHPIPDEDPQMAARQVDEDKRPQQLVRSWVWTLVPDWRPLLLQWVEQRLNPIDRLTIKLVQSLLDRFDPSIQWIRSIEDALSLCAAIENAKVKPLDVALGSGAAGKYLLEQLRGRQETQSQYIEQLATARWARWDLPLTGGITADAWRQLSLGLCNFDDLLKRGVISATAQGFDFKNPIVARLLLRDHLLEILCNDDISSWAPACFDAQRRPIIDAALDVSDVMTIARLEELWERVVPVEEPAQRVGAAEAIFAAIGRRAISGKPSGEKLETIARDVVDRMRRNDDYTMPFSRPVDSLASGLDWLSVCWAWSLIPGCAVANTFVWQFPGWHSLIPDTVDDRLLVLGRYAYEGSPDSWAVLAESMQRLLKVVWRWLGTQSGNPVRLDRPAVFNAALLAHADKTHFHPDLGWWSGVFGNPAAERALLTLASAEMLPMQRLAEAWWPSLVQFIRTSGDHGVEPARQSKVFELVMEQLEPKVDEALQSLHDDEDRRYLTDHPSILSPIFKRRLFAMVIQESDFGMPVWQVYGFLASFGSDTATELEPLLDHETLGLATAQNLWDWRARHTVTLVRRPGKLGKLARRNLVLPCPPAALATAIARLQEEPDLIQNEQKEVWVRIRLPDSGKHASDLLRLLKP
ncbi:hypothetical protein [Paraburkholderia sp. 22B1P]|uniref:hypothetical protein n=1 Tax=Paraburkholderia sp. 22B1P TaxID=3080498 RepID=UPI003086B6D1|nr:hypothetical protein PBP221_86720 [Paraburkholderia sp. 22B1P]